MRAKLSTLCLEKENEGGKIAEAGIVENYPGYESIKGFELAQKFSEHVITSYSIHYTKLYEVDICSSGLPLICWSNMQF